MRGRAFAVLSLVLAAAALAGSAHGEQRQEGDLVVSLDGGISPLRLPRDRPGPVSVHLSGGIRTTDGSLLPRVTTMEIGLPSQGSLSTRGLPTCTARRLRNTKPPAALGACGGALVGRGSLVARVLMPDQRPLTIHARLLLFNSRERGGRRAVLLHAFARRPPIVVVVPFVLRRRPGTFGTVLQADLPQALGPRPRLARFQMTLYRRYRYRGRSRSYLNASCPVPPRFTAGFLSLARSTYTLAGGEQIAVEITRGCRGI